MAFPVCQHTGTCGLGWWAINFILPSLHRMAHWKTVPALLAVNWKWNYLPNLNYWTVVGRLIVANRDVSEIDQINSSLGPISSVNGKRNQCKQPIMSLQKSFRTDSFPIAQAVDGGFEILNLIPFPFSIHLWAPRVASRILKRTLRLMNWLFILPLSFPPTFY